ncbi:uncharacterized protein LOC128373259 [Scomber japonicus]|uniref:uncharacterized protein LOC128373259 n=1 Tax=Scomber japonicus TaxID=13676 RepID=UPI002305D731|nr:uncharacterized protein LOC128373259 [Scomber japonicus]
METLTRCFMLVLLLSAVLSSGLTEEKFIRDGGTLELRPNFSGDIDTVTWKLNNYLMVAEWVEGINAVTYYDVFESRTTLNKETGTLEITNMSPADSGVYSVEINNMVLPERYNVKVIKEVPQPVVELNPLSCSDASDNCTLLCEGKSDEAVALAEAEPVTYSWRMGDREWMDGEKSRDITNNKETQRVETFSCRMKNPISEKQSDPIPNPFYREDPAEHLFYKEGLADFGLWLKGAKGISWLVGLILSLIVCLMWCCAKLSSCLIRKDDNDDDDNDDDDDDVV